jgi:hypothetical protein
MSKLLSLHAPQPATPLAFEETFFGEYNALIRLTQARQAAASAAAALDATDATRISEHVEALRAYALAWRKFVHETVYDRGSVSRTRLPLEFSWRVALVSGDQDTTYTDASPLLETACSTLAYVAALQRWGAVSDTTHALELAVEELESLRSNVLEPFVIPHVAPPSSADTRRREPAVLSALFCRSLAKAVRAQLLVKRAVSYLQGAEPSSDTASHMASLLFAARSSFNGALSILPTNAHFADAQRTVSALAHRYVAEALVDSSSDDAQRGLAVALAQAAHRMHPTNVAVQKYATELNERNAVEFGMQTVPSWESIELRAANDDSTAGLVAERHNDGWIVHVPVTPVS